MNRRERRSAWLAQHRAGSSEHAGLDRESGQPTRQTSADPGSATSEVLRPPAVRLHVEELHLHGFATADRHVIGDALQTELTRLFVERGFPASLTSQSEVEHLDAGRFAIPPGTRANAIGVQVARAVYGGPTP